MLVEVMIVYGNVCCSGDVLRMHRKSTRALEQFGVDTSRSLTFGTKVHLQMEQERCRNKMIGKQRKVSVVL